MADEKKLEESLDTLEFEEEVEKGDEAPDDEE